MVASISSRVRSSTTIESMPRGASRWENSSPAGRATMIAMRVRVVGIVASGGRCVQARRLVRPMQVCPREPAPATRTPIQREAAFRLPRPPRPMRGSRGDVSDVEHPTRHARAGRRAAAPQKRGYHAALVSHGDRHAGRDLRHGPADMAKPAERTSASGRGHDRVSHGVGGWGRNGGESTLSMTRRARGQAIQVPMTRRATASRPAMRATLRPASGSTIAPQTAPRRLQSPLAAWCRGPALDRFHEGQSRLPQAQNTRARCASSHRRMPRRTRWRPSRSRNPAAMRSSTMRCAEEAGSPAPRPTQPRTARSDHP